MQIRSLHHVNLKVLDVNRAATFYTEVLGLKIHPDRPPSSGLGAWLYAGDQQIHLTPGTPPDNQGQHFALEVADLDQAIEEAESAGISVKKRATGPINQISFLDPTGNQIELRRPAS